MQTIAKSTAGSLLLLAALSIGTLFFRIGALPFIGNDEPRYARIAEEMAASGSWTTPTLEGKPWLEKPPLYYWSTIPFLSAVPDREAAARCAPALGALVTALALFWLGTALWNRLSGLLGGSIALTSLGFVAGGRTAATDMPFTCCLTLGLACLAAAARRDPGPLKILAAYAFLGLAVLGKGPVAVILAAGIGLLYWYLHDRGDTMRRWRVCRGIPVLLLVGAPWFWLAFRENGYAFVATFFVNHNLARYVTEIHHHSQPIYFYIPVLLLLMFPWSGWLPFLITESPLKTLRRWRHWDPGMLFLTCWFLVPLLFFSMSDSKLAGYILPSLPPASLILGARIARRIEDGSASPVLRISMVLSLALSAVMALGAPLYFRKDYGGDWETGLLLSPVLFLPALLAAAFGFRNRCGKAAAATLVHGLLVVVAAVVFAFPALGTYHSARDLAGLALKVRLEQEPIVTYGIVDHSLQYYTGYEVLGKVDDPVSLGRLSREHGGVLVVTKGHRIGELAIVEGFSAELLGTQGDFRLLRLRRE